MSTTTTSKSTAALLAALLAVSLSACGKNESRTAGEKMDAGVAKTEQAASTVAEKVDDAAITASVNAGLANDSELSAIKIDVDTKGGAVVLKGPAPTPSAKARAEEIAKSVKGVSSVDNQLEVKTM